MFVLMSSRSSSKLGHVVSKTRSPGQISRKLCYNHFELWSECLPWSVLDQALKVLCCSGECYRAIMALLFFLCCGSSLEDPLWGTCNEYHSICFCGEIRKKYAGTLRKTCKYIENFTTKHGKFSDKNSDIFHISAQNIDCGYSFELPRWQF